MAKELHRAPESLSVWESNMKELRRRQSGLALVLDEYVGRHGHEFAHYQNETPAGRWIEGLTEKPFFQPNEAQWKFPWSRKTKKTPVFFLYGAGVAPYLFRAIRALPASALSLIVVEPSVALLAFTLHLTHVYHAMPPGAKLNFIVRPDTSNRLEELPEEERALELSRMRRALLDEALTAGVTTFGIFTVTQAEGCSHPGEEKIDKDVFVEVAKNVTEWAILRLQSLGNSAEDTMIGLRQMALMAPWMIYGSSTKCLLEAFKERPFVVVSAGPSLEKNFERLREIQDKSVLIATDAVLHKMLKAGIRPHIVCALERGMPTYDTLFADSIDEYPEECAKVLLITQAVCVPKIYGRWPGPKIIIGKRDVPVDKWFLSGILHWETLLSGSSVAHMNYAIAAGLGASSIAVIGQDLAFGGGGRTHAGGIFESVDAAFKPAEPAGTAEPEGDEDKTNKSEEPEEEPIKPDGAEADTQSVSEREDEVEEEAGPGPKPEGATHQVPGALGGTVWTHETWLSFLRTLENFIAIFKVPAWDCTEGGALIAGTTIAPFAEYIEKHVASLEPLERTPAEVVGEAPRPEDKTELFTACEERFDAALAGLLLIEDTIDEMEETIQHVGAAGLEPARRIAYAQAVGRLIDRITDSNEMFAFVTQSYVYLATMELAITRSLETVDEIERWTTIHREIVESHRAVLSFIRTWANYGREHLRYYATRDVPFEPLSADDAWELLRRLGEEGGPEKPDSVEESGEGELNVRFEIDAFLGRCDPIRLNWPGRVLWSLADVLMEEGRSQEAVSYADRAVKDFEGKEMPVAEMAAFFKDYANMLSTHDLCFSPPYHKAEIMLSNAVELAGERDEEAKKIMDKILEGEIASYENIASLLRGHHIGASKWFRARSLGERALMDGEIDKALLLVWKAIREHWQSVPDWAASHMDWLARTLEQCVSAQDVRVRTAAEEVIAEFAAESDLLRTVQIHYNERFAELLRERGMDPAVPLRVRAAAPAEANGGGPSEPEGIEEPVEDGVLTEAE